MPRTDPAFFSADGGLPDARVQAVARALGSGVQASAHGRESEHAKKQLEYAVPMLEVSVPCGSCGKPIRGGDEFCESCGARVTDELKNALRERLEASDFNYFEHRKRVRNARTTIGVLAVLFVLGGIFLFFVTRSQADDALVKLAGSDDAALLEEPIADATTVGELRAAIEREPLQVLGLNVFLAAVMLGLWVWSRRALLPAIITALGIYVTVIVASALYDPKTIVQGIIIKIIVIAALAKGVQSALAARKLELAR